MKKLFKKITSALLACILVLTSLSGISQAAIQVNSPLVINEIVPDTDNLNGSDAYEFFEIQNVSNTSINVDDYIIRYNVSDIWQLDDKGIVLEPQATLTVWVKNPNNQDLVAQDFNTYYQTSLVQGQNFTTVQSNGFHNSKQRDLAIVTQTGQVLVLARYNEDDIKLVQKDKSINFIYNPDDVMETRVGYDALVTPGVTNPDQVVDGSFQLTSNAAGSITTSASLNLTFNKSWDLTASQNVSNLILSAKVLIKGDTDTEYKEYPLSYDSDSFVTTIPFADLAGYKSFSWNVEMSDGVNSYTSAEKITKVQQGELDRSKFPNFLITEILPDSSNVGGADAYEFIEVTNNSDSVIDFQDYQLHYNYPDNGPDNNVLWFETNKELLVEPGNSIVFWVKNGKNDDLTADDFNAHFTTDLVLDQNLFEIFQGGMANGGARGLYVKSKVGDTIDYILYNENGADNTYKDQSIVYQLDTETAKSFMLGDQNPPTPGNVPLELANEYSTYQAATGLPVYEDQTPASFDNNQVLTFAMNITGQATNIKSVLIAIKDNLSQDYEIFNLVRSIDNPDVFSYSLDPIDLTNKQSYDYYFIISDGSNRITTDPKTVVSKMPEQQALRYNHADGSTITGQTIVSTTGEKLLLDGADVTGQTRPSLENDAIFVFEASQTDAFFKNAVAIGDEVIGIFDEGTYGDWRTYSYPVSSSKILKGNNLVVDIHAGNKSNPLVHDIENNDDFVVKNIRLILPDGNSIKAEGFTNPEELIKMGDSAGKIEFLNAVFAISDTSFNSIAFEFNTNDYAEGKHVFSSSLGADSLDLNLIFDNLGPIITSNLEEGKEYKQLALDVQINDTYSDVLESTIRLDGKRITLPYDIKSTELEAGDHVLSVYALDSIGNASSKVINFTTPIENPEIVEVSPADNSVINGIPSFTASIEDATCDDLTVTFKKGEAYSLGEENVLVTKGVADKAGSDKDVFAPESGDGFPYEMYEVTGSDQVDVNGKIRFEWTGTTSNEKTYLYAYNVNTQNWDKFDAEKVEDTELTLRAIMDAKDYLLDNKVKVMIQNGEGFTPEQFAEGTPAATPQFSHITTSNAQETPRSEYDFTFAIESDTQYYNEDVPTNPNIIGKYQYQLDIHDWVLANMPKMNIQYLFHDGDIIDDNDIIEEWYNADKAYKMLEDGNLPYGILAGNHDVSGHANDYTNYSTYFGEKRFADKPFYGESYKDNRGHYDLISVDGIDFIMVYMGWHIDDEEIEWMNEILAKYPERHAILNFHEYLLASGGLGEQPQRIKDEVIATNPNVKMVLSGHYHNAQRVETPYDDDGDGTTDRIVQQMLFDYQGLTEGGMGYMRLMHWDNTAKTVTVRTYSPSLDDYDAKDYPGINAEKTVGEEHFSFSYADLGIEPQVKSINTSKMTVSFDSEEVIGQVQVSGCNPVAEYTWDTPVVGTFGWYAEVTDDFGGMRRSPVNTLTITATAEDSGYTPGPVNLRLSPNGEVIESIPMHTFLSGTKESIDSRWLKVTYDGKEGYVYAPLLADELVEGYSVGIVNTRKSPMGTIISSLMEGQYVKGVVYAEKNTWVNTRINGENVYVFRSLLQDKPVTFTGYPKGIINLRDAQTNEIMTSIAKFAELSVTIDGLRPYWGHVEYNGMKGIVYLPNLTKELISESATIKGPTNVRTAPITRDNIIGVLAEDDEIKGIVDPIKTGWLVINYFGKTAYVWRGTYQ